MTQKQRAARPPENQEQDGSASGYRQNSTFGPARQAPAHGFIRGNVWYKTVLEGEHLLKWPRSAWAVDQSDLEICERRGVLTLELRATDTKKLYRVSLQRFRLYGFPVNREYGEQIALALGYFQIIPDNAAGPVQLTFNLGGRP